MDDLISRQAAIDALDEIRHALWEIDIPSPTVPEYVEHHEQVQSVWKLLDKKQKELYLLPSAQPEQRWIPCSERLPEKNCRCLTTNTALGAFEVDFNVWINGEWLYPNKKPIAWMPLPEPYKENDHD